jgi:hypothetical protein
MKRNELPGWSLGTLLVLCAGLAAKFQHVRVSFPEIAWWGWPLLVLGGIALNVGFFLWLARMSDEHREVRGAGPVQAAAGVVALLLVVL